MLVPVAAWVCGLSPAEIVCSNPTGAWMFACCKCCVLSGRGLCDELITLPEESYRLWCVVMCDLETLWMRRPLPTGGGAVMPKTTLHSIVPLWRKGLQHFMVWISCMKYCTWFLQLLTAILFEIFTYFLHWKTLMKIGIYWQQKVYCKFCCVCFVTIPCIFATDHMFSLAEVSWMQFWNRFFLMQYVLIWVSLHNSYQFAVLHTLLSPNLHYD
jgi:hypothetical protein